MQAVNYIVLYWKLLLASSLLLLLTCLSNKFFKLPINDLSLLAYILSVFLASAWITFMTLQNFLQQNKPTDILKFCKFSVKTKEHKFDNLSVKQLTEDIDKYFIYKWFVYISSDPTFNKESRVLLEEILTKIMNVQLSLDKEVIIHGSLNLYLKHLKEFRRSLKRREKYLGKITELYRYSHSCSSSKRAKNYFIHQLTVNLLNHFINWELGNSLPYQILVSIISKKVLLYILNLLSDPEFLNYCILVTCASKSKQLQLDLAAYNRVKITQMTEKGDITPSDLTKSGSKASLVTTNDETTETETVANKDFEIKTEEVKIYEPRSCKTWYDPLDLSSIPLGQDILDTISLGDSDRDLEGSLIDEKDLSPMTSAKNLLDEVKQMTSLEGLKTSMKPISDATFHNIKEIQESTVNSVVKPMSQATSTALHRIGGLHLQDEAAGVVEGLLDFGRTRIRKGLRLTGLQDSPEEAIKPPTKKQITKMTHVRSQEKTDDTDDGQVKLEPLTKIPSIQTHEEGSPEPEYEETADLATSIAKLRSLLEQKSSESNLSTPALSPMPGDDLFNKNLEAEDVDETDGLVPSFYKLCAKTATGVISNTLNTIKTALPGNVVSDRYDGAEKWLFVESNSTDSDLSTRMHKLLCERKIFCTVDTAYEAIDSLGSLERSEKLRQSNIQFEDELDDFEVKLPVTKALCDIVCELLADTRDTSLTQEPVIRSVLLLFGNYIEETVMTQTNFYLRHGCAHAKIPAESKIETLSLELVEFVTVMLSGVPDCLKYLLGEQTLRDAANLFVSSLQVQKINQDLVMQIFEVVCMKLMEGSKEMSPISA